MNLNQLKNDENFELICILIASVLIQIVSLIITSQFITADFHVLLILIIIFSICELIAICHEYYLRLKKLFLQSLYIAGSFSVIMHLYYPKLLILSLLTFILLYNFTFGFNITRMLLSLKSIKNKTRGEV